MNLQRILIPVDFSIRARVALRYAVDLARSTGAAIDVLHVLPAPPSLMVAVDAYLGLPMPHAPSTAREQADAQLSTLISSIDCAGISVHVLVEEGDPAATIVQIASEGPYDLIVLGTHGRIGLADLMRGSVAKRLITCAPCPVVTMRATDTPTA
jgi:nucleotide-binding universal stress UspA family protein